MDGIQPFHETAWLIVSALLILAGAVSGYWLRAKQADSRSRELEAQIANRARHLAALNAVATVTSQSWHLQETLDGALAKTLEVTGLEAGGIYLLKDDGQTLTIGAHRGLDESIVRAIDDLKAGEGFSGRVIQTGEPLIVPDVAADTRLTRHAVQEMGFRAAAVVPLAARGRVLGTMFLIPRRERDFSEPEIELLASIGRQVGMAVEQARLFEAEARRAEQFRIIVEVGRRFAQTLDINELLSQVVRLIQQTFGYYHVGIGLVEGEEVVYRVGAGALWDDPQFEFSPGRLKVGQEGLTGWVAGTGQPLLVPDVSRELRYVWMQGSRTRSELVMPINAKGQTIGVLDVQSDRLNAFDDKDVNVLQSLANQAGAAIENARLYEQAQQLAVMEERSRLARDLHDSVSQSLYGMTLYAQAAAGHLAAGRMDRVADQLRELQDTSQEVLAEMRLLIFELRPPLLTEQGLAAALQARLLAVEGRAGIKTEFRSEVPDRLPLPVEEGLYRIAQEALNNCLRHAHARHLTVRLRRENSRATLTITDDGMGFDPLAVREHGGLGLSDMQERAAQLGGWLRLLSQPGAGTQVIVEVCA
jgi:signal transduction histidine kinase